MKLLNKGIHKRIGFIVQHIGGYDQEYHISSVATELNIDKVIISRLFKESSSSDILHYVDLLSKGASVESVFKIVEHDNRIARIKLDSTLSMLENCIYGLNNFY